MRVLLFLGLLLIASPAFALSDAAIDYCLGTPNPKACLQAVSTDVEQRKLDAQREQQQQYLQTQLEQARIQANGMAAFGAGNAMINGMNRGLQNMQLPPPPIQHP